MDHNSYFEGRVQSLAMRTPEGNATVGVIEPGTYTFSTNSEEHMTIVAGSAKVKLPGADWRTIEKGETFIVPAKSSFEIGATTDLAYICYYINPERPFLSASRPDPIPNGTEDHKPGWPRAD